MQIIKRAVIALSFILALMALPTVTMADEDEEDLFTEYVIPADVNKGFLITECGSILVLGVAVFDGPDDVKGKLLIVVRPPGVSQSQGDMIMNGLLTEAVLKYKADGRVFELSDVTDRFCA